MSDELGGRLVRAIAFGALMAIGLGLVFGFQSRALLLVIVIAICMMFSAMVSTAMAASLGVFAYGVALWAGLLPHDLGVADLAKRASGAFEQRAVLVDSDAIAAKPATLSERLEQLSLACQKGLLGDQECKTTRESLIAKFKNAQ